MLTNDGNWALEILPIFKPSVFDGQASDERIFPNGCKLRFIGGVDGDKPRDIADFTEKTN